MMFPYSSNGIADPLFVETLVRMYPEAAAQMLRDMGYDIRSPGAPEDLIIDSEVVCVE
jgi:hypothetical protein